MAATIKDSKSVLVIGATAGIGRALALSIAKLPSHPQVIAAGRRQERLEEVAALGLETIKVDIDTDLDTLKRFVDDVVAKYPQLDTVIFSAGIEYELDFKASIDIKQIIGELNINYTSVVAIITYLLPHFLKLGAQGQPCFFIPITSGLGIIAGAWIPNYSATKAALRSFSTSLRFQLEGTNVHVLEIIPPLVESELHDNYGYTEQLSKIWIPLDEFVKGVMAGLESGEHHIGAGLADIAFKNFEQGKLGLIRQALQQRHEW